MFDETGCDVRDYSSLPREWFKDIEGAMFLGRPFMEYSKEELAVIAARGWIMYQRLERKRKAKINKKCVE